jgi:hypothetical protein
MVNFYIDSMLEAGIKLGLKLKAFQLIITYAGGHLMI